MISYIARIYKKKKKRVYAATKITARSHADEIKAKSVITINKYVKKKTEKTPFHTVGKKMIIIKTMRSDTAVAAVRLHVQV